MEVGSPAVVEDAPDIGAEKSNAMAVGISGTMMTVAVARVLDQVGWQDRLRRYRRGGRRRLRERVGEAGQCVERTAATAATHGTLRNTQHFGGHAKPRLAFRALGIHRVSFIQARSYIAPAAREQPPTVACASHADIKPRLISDCHCLCLLQQQTAQSDASAGSHATSEELCQFDQRTRQDVRQQHVGGCAVQFAICRDLDTGPLLRCAPRSAASRAVPADRCPSRWRSVRPA